EDRFTIAQLQEVVASRFGFTLSDAEIRATSRITPEGLYDGDIVTPAITEAIDASLGPPRWRAIAAPALAFYAAPRPAVEMMPWVAHDKEANAVLERILQERLAPQRKQLMARFTAEVKRGTAVEVVGANHAILARHSAEVERAMRQFWSAFPA